MEVGLTVVSGSGSSLRKECFLSSSCVGRTFCIEDSDSVINWSIEASFVLLGFSLNSCLFADSLSYRLCFRETYPLDLEESDRSVCLEVWNSGDFSDRGAGLFREEKFLMGLSFGLWPVMLMIAVFESMSLAENWRGRVEALLFSETRLRLKMLTSSYFREKGSTTACFSSSFFSTVDSGSGSKSIGDSVCSDSGSSYSSSLSPQVRSILYSEYLMLSSVFCSSYFFKSSSCFLSS